jgi:hypothetical protein
LKDQLATARAEHAEAAEELAKSEAIAERDHSRDFGAHETARSRDFSALAR